MSLLPMKSLSGTLPVIFIEARLQGPPEIVFSQLGISFDADHCNIALFMRTSGVLLVASVGSYMVYRICSRLLGRDFIWTILEQARIDLLARNDTYLLNPKVPFEASARSYSSSELADDELSGSCSFLCESHTLAALLSPGNSPLRRRLRRTARARQLRITSVEDSRRRSYTDDTDAGSKHDRHSVSITTRGSSRVGFTSSEKSASLHLLWDDPQWDEEADFSFHDTSIAQSGRQRSTISDVSDMTEFRAAKELFGESDKCSRIVPGTDRENGEEDGADQDECASGHGEKSSDLDADRDFIARNCMTDSKHLYQIATGYITTDSMSVSSERSSRSFLSLRQRLTAITSSSGLLELGQCSTASPLISPVEQLPASMTDSGISKGTASTSNLQPFLRSGPGLESIALGGVEFSSSEDEAVAVIGVSFMPALPPYKNSIIRRTNLNLINEDRCSPTTSTRSAEWFEDEYCPTGTPNSIQEVTEVDDCLAACFSGSSNVQLCESGTENRRKHLYGVSRDLMAWARGRFAAESPQLKAIQSLYTSAERWRRIGLKRSTNCSQQFLISLVHSMVLHGIPFFGFSDMLLLTKAVQRAFSHYEFVKQWKFSDETIEIENKENYAISLLQTLWNVQQGVQQMDDEAIEHCCVEAVRLLALLWIVHCFEKLETGRGEQQQCSPFYAELFGNRNPRQIVEDFCKNQLNHVDFALITDTLRVKLELVDCSSCCCTDLDAVEQAELPRICVPEGRAEKEVAIRPILTFLKLNQNFLYPLYHNVE